MINYEIDPVLLRPLVPQGTSLDLWEGRALISLVGFRFLNTRVLGYRIPWHVNFDEVNLRFYVRRECADGTVRRGVTFIREFVPRAAIAIVARLFYNEPYLTAQMRHVAPSTLVENPGEVAYAWRTANGWQRISARARGAARVPAPASEATFITEHYWGYTAQRDGSTVEYEVEHPSWRVWDVGETTVRIDALSTYGAPYADALSGPPCSAFMAEGSPVVVYRQKRLREDIV